MLLIVLVASCGALTPRERQLSQSCGALAQYYTLRDLGIAPLVEGLDGRLENALEPCDVFKSLVFQKYHPFAAVPDSLPDDLMELIYGFPKGNLPGNERAGSRG